MKKNLLVLFLALGIGRSFAQNQNVGIGTTTPDASAILDLTSTDKGLLAPRLTTAQRTAIAAPANGLLVFDINIGCYFYYNSGWFSLCQLSGPTGAAGITGPQGATGNPGPAGAPGAPGASGANGVTGPQGPAGATGAAGTPGVAGATGLQGLPGITGPQGATGAQGATGNDGVTGAQGLQGVTGNDGAQGIPGVTGAQGIQGVTGAQGDVGATGPQGPQGIPGINASTGSQGAPGATGAVGATGPTGAQGVQGITGAQGVQGITGAQGIQGLQGITGAQGVQGVQGITGAQGVQGITGAQGIKGDTGAQGIQGVTGTQGLTGPVGPSGAQGVQGLQGITGVQGVQGVTGVQGNIGLTGAAGATGATGFLQPGGVFTMPYYNASTPAWVTTATNIYDNGTNVAIGPVGGTTVATTTEKLTVLGAAISGINVTTTSTTAGQYALHANGSLNGDAYLGYINTALTVSGEAIPSPTAYFTSSANVPLAAVAAGTNPAIIGINTSATGGQAGFMLSNDPATDALDVFNNAALGNNIADGIYTTTSQSTGFALEAWNGGTNGTGDFAVGNNLLFGLYLPTGSGGAFTGNNTGAFGVETNGITAGASYVDPYAGVYGEDTIAASLGSVTAMYHFGVWGLNNDASIGSRSTGRGTRSGGVLGSTLASTTSTFGSLAYTNSGDNVYGIYYTSTATGTGFLPSNAQYGIGSGGNGGVIGSWTRGAVMGQVSCGELFASYNLGNSYTSGYQAELVDMGDKRAAAFSVTSTDIKVYGDGNAALQNGTATVKFDAAFAAMLGAAPNVTVTPIGESNGLYIVSMDKTGFTVKENKGGQSNIQFTWIAVGNRIDAANKPELPKDLADKNFDANMKDVMFDESNLEHTAKPIWWDGQKVRFDQPTGTASSSASLKVAPKARRAAGKKVGTKSTTSTSNK